MSKKTLVAGALGAATFVGVPACGPAENPPGIHQGQGLDSPSAIASGLRLIGFPQLAEASSSERYRIVTFMFRKFPEKVDGIMVIDDRDGEVYPVHPALFDGALYVETAMPMYKSVISPKIKFFQGADEIGIFRGQLDPETPISTFYDLSYGGSSRVLEDQGRVTQLALGKPEKITPSEWQWLGVNDYKTARLEFVNPGGPKQFALKVTGDGMPVFLVRGASIQKIEAPVTKFTLGNLESLCILPASVVDDAEELEILVEE